MGSFNNAYLKLERAQEQIDEISQFLRSNPPYTYILETDFKERTRATLAKKNEISLDKLIVRCGEFLHNLRSAIDQAYWEAVSPFITGPGKDKSIQFPFAKDEATLDQTIKSRLGHYPGERFFEAVKSLRPFSGPDGNALLVLLHEINIIDKHKFPMPAGNFSRIHSTDIQKHIPDFPRGLYNCGVGQSKKDVVWNLTRYSPEDIKTLHPPYLDVYHRVLNLPVETWFYIASPCYQGEVIDTLRKLNAEVRLCLDTMAAAIR